MSRDRRSLRGCWVGLAVALVLACASDEERFAEHMARAEQYLEAHDDKEALLEYRSALQLAPKNAEVNHRIADVLRNNGAMQDAAFFYREAYRLDPDRIDAAMEEAQILLFTDTERTEEIIEEGLRRYPNVPIVHVARSRLALLKGDTEAALTAIMTGIQLAPDDPVVWLQLGTVHQARIREHRLRKREEPEDALFEAAIQAYERANQLEGGAVNALIERARVLATWMGHADESEQAYREVVALAREQAEKLDSPEIALYAADAANRFARQARRNEMRVWALRQILAIDDSRIQTWDELAHLADGMNRGDGEKVYAELLEQRPDDPMAHSYYASFLIELDRVQDAVQHITGVLETDHGTPGLWEQLMRIQLNNKNLPAARATYVQMADAYPDDPITERAEARIALAERRRERAAEILRSLSGKAESFETLRLLAYAEFQLGNLPAATAAIDRALALAGTFSADAVRLKARIHHDAEDWVLAARTLRTLVGRGVRLNEQERLMRARVFYETHRARVGREVLEMLLAEKDPPPEAAVEFAVREGRQLQQRTYRYLTAAWERHPLDADVLEQLMKIDVQRREPVASLRRLNQVIQTGRAGPRILLLRAELMARTGDYDRAEADALRAFEAAPQLPGAVDLLLAVYAAQGRLDEARRSFEEAEAAGVLHSGARLLLARLYMEQGEAAKAEEMLEKVIAERPDDAGAKNDLAFLLAQQGRDLDRALRMAQEAQEALGRHPNAADTVGFVFYHKQLYEAALQQFRYAMELAAKSGGGISPAYHYHAGLALRALGREDEAARAFEKALELDADFPNADDARQQLEAARAAALPGSPSPS